MNIATYNQLLIDIERACEAREMAESDSERAELTTVIAQLSDAIEAADRAALGPDTDDDQE